MVELLAGIESLREGALLVALSTTRIAVAFMILPLLAPDTVPAMVRNAIFMSLGLLALALQGPVPIDGWGLGHWLLLLFKEAAIGMGIGFGMAAFLWAFEAAGQLIDTQLSVSNAQVTDPMSGQQVSITGAFLGRLASYLFMQLGGLALLVGVLLESMALWPVASLDIGAPRAGVAWFEHQLSDLMGLALLIAAPGIVVMFAIDFTLGLINRFAPQLNVSALSMSLKSISSVVVLLLLFGTIVQTFADRLGPQLRQLLPQLQRVLPMG